MVVEEEEKGVGGGSSIQGSLAGKQKWTTIEARGCPEGQKSQSHESSKGRWATGRWSRGLGVFHQPFSNKFRDLHNLEPPTHCPRVVSHFRGRC